MPHGAMSPPDGRAGLEAAFARHLATLRLAPGAGLVAVSGGPDSLALLHLLVRCRGAHPLDLRVAHVDHGIHPDSAQVAARVAAIAEGLGVSCDIGRLGLGAGASETEARVARYRWLLAALDRHRPGVLLTAHHRDDQVETVLMRALRGSGPAGLAGMPAVGPRIVRPLLPFSRAEVRGYLTTVGIAAWDDPANLDPAHLRSWLRGDILPAIRQRLPDVDDRLLRVAAQAGADRAAWDALLEALPLALRHDRDTISVDSAVLRGYDTRLGWALVRALGRRVGLMLGARHTGRILRLAETDRSGTRLDLGQGWTAAVDFHRLSLHRRPSVGAWTMVIEGSSGETGAGGWVFRWRSEPAPEVMAREAATTWVLPGRYDVRPWRPGDAIRPLGGVGRRPVVRCMQDRRVPRRERPGWPVVISREAVVWVPEVCRAAHDVPVGGVEALRIDAERV